MSHVRRPLSLLASVALGIGAALLVLLAGGRPAAQNVLATFVGALPAAAR